MDRTIVRRGVAAAALALCALLAAFFAQRPASAADGSVSIASFAFSPASVTINVGDSVTWTNNQAGVSHAVTSDTGAFDSGTLSSGGVFSHTFSTAGTFAYHCNIHPSMQGTVIVQSATGPTNTPQATATQPAATNTPATPTSTTAASTATPTATTPAATATATSPAATNTQPAPTTTAVGAATATATRPATVLPPNTGSGSGDGGVGLPLIAGGAIVLLGLGGAATFLVRSRRA